MVRVSIESSPKPIIKPTSIILLAGLAILSVSTYLIASHFYYRIGFPLDDAWIHQTYARNLANLGEWAFLPGQISGGSTSPLWTILLSIGFLFHISPYFWTFGLGTVALWSIAVLAEIAARRHLSSYRPNFPWLGCLLIFEWHLAWAAVSGMETLAFSAVVLWVLLTLAEEGTHGYFKIGLLIGVSVWLRPEGITLLGPAFLIGLLENLPIKKRLISLMKICIGFGSLFSLYLLFSLALTGNPWPTTFYAKQAEYAILSNQSWVGRFGGFFIQPLVGVGSLLLPGAILLLIESIRKRNWGILTSFLWLLGTMGLYAWRLPTIYQHGRYVIPCMLVLFTFSCFGVIRYFQQQNRIWSWAIKLSWKITILLILIIFWVNGVFVYSNDVAYIESEMVETSKWMAANIADDALIASHDIGALGYFGQHNIIDLAGLISPDVIPFIRDETRLGEYLDAKEVDYLVTFPSWYPELIKGLLEIFSTSGRFALDMGGENLIIYQWRK
jgi:hypothetical protein